jgi:hypothetical protein
VIAPRLIPLALAVALVPAAGVRGAAARPPHGTGPTRLVFDASVARDQTQIYSIDPSGRRRAQLTFGAESASGPLPSPDGTHVVFRRGAAIWVMRPNGRGRRLLAARGITPAWTPDSRRVAYLSETAQQGPVGIRMVALDGGEQRTLVRGADVRDPAWSPDGRSLAFARGGSLIVRRAGIQRTVVKRPGVAIERIEWSADGRWLAFEYQDPARGFGAEVVGANGRNARNVGGAEPGTASWAPNHPALAYVQFALDSGSSSFRLLTPATGRIRKLAGAPRFVNSLVWSPRGNALAFSGGAYLSEDLTAVSELGILGLTGSIRFLDHGAAYPLPDAVAWTKVPASLPYRAPVPIGPVVSKHELRFREPVDELALDGDRVAYRSCGTIGVWRPGDANVVSAQIDRPLCVEGNVAFYSLALAGNQIAWGTLRGGNQQFNTLTFETVGDRGPQTVVAAHSQLAGDPRGNDRAGNLLGNAQLLVFSTWAYCNEVVPVACPNLPFGQATAVASQTLWRVRDSSWPGDCPGAGSDQTRGHCEQLRAEPGPLRPLDVDANRIVVSGDNATLVLDSDGRQLLSVPISTTAAQLSGPDFVVLVRGALRDYDASTGSLLHSWPLPEVSFGGVCGGPDWLCGSPHLRLEGAARGVVAYLLDGKLHLLRLQDGADVAVGDSTGAQLDDSGLFYAYRAAGLWPGRIRFVAFDRLPLR